MREIQTLYFVKIDGFLPVIDDKPIAWYPMQTKQVNGVETDHEGNIVRRGVIVTRDRYALQYKAAKLLEGIWPIVP